MKLYRNWIINEVARAGEHTNERTYVLTYIRTGQTLYPLHNFVVRGDNKLCILGFQIMKNNIKKAPVKFWEDLLYFSILCRFLFLLQISDYHHLKRQSNRENELSLSVLTCIRKIVFSAV